MIDFCWITLQSVCLYVGCLKISVLLFVIKIAEYKTNKDDSTSLSGLQLLSTLPPTLLSYQYEPDNLLHFCCFAKILNIGSFCCLRKEELMEYNNGYY